MSSVVKGALRDTMHGSTLWNHISFPFWLLVTLRTLSSNITVPTNKHNFIKPPFPIFPGCFTIPMPIVPSTMERYPPCMYHRVTTTECTHHTVNHHTVTTTECTYHTVTHHTVHRNHHTVNLLKQRTTTQ